MGSQHDSIRALAERVFCEPWPNEVKEQISELNKRLPHLVELGALAYRDKDKEAWRLIQEGIFNLPRFRVSSCRKDDSQRRPLFRGDILSSGISDMLWEIEDRHIERLQPPKPVVGEEGAQFIEDEFRRRSVLHHPYFEYLATVRLSEEQQKEVILLHLQSVMVRIRTIHRVIMMGLLPQDFHDCIRLSKMLIDELGGGDIEHAHARRAENTITRWGGTVDWHASVDSVEMMAMLNWNLRTVSHPDSLWSAVGLFCVEWNAWLELRQAMLSLRRRGIPDYFIEVLVVHGETAPDGYDADRHALKLRQELGRHLKKPEDTALAMSCIAHHQRLYGSFFDMRLETLKKKYGA